MRATEAQFGLSAAEREKNLAMAFNLGSGFRHHRPTNVLLLDDIYTTGETVKSAVQTLRQAKIQVCGLVAVATSQTTKQQQSKVKNWYASFLDDLYNKLTNLSYILNDN